MGLRSYPFKVTLYGRCKNGRCVALHVRMLGCVVFALHSFTYCYGAFAAHSDLEPTYKQHHLAVSNWYGVYLTLTVSLQTMCPTRNPGIINMIAQSVLLQAEYLDSQLGTAPYM